VVQRVRRTLNLDAGLDAAMKVLEADPEIGRLVRVRPGIRPPGTCDPFETGVRAIIGQQISVRGAGTITTRLVERHGTPVAGLRALGLTHLFPSPSSLAEADLRGLGLTSVRSDAVNAFARAVDDGTVLLDGASSLDDLVASIAAVPGLGPWTAQYMALRMGEPDAFPAADLGIRRSLSRGDDKPVSSREAEARAERWRPWRAFAAIHLWLAGAPKPRPATTPDRASTGAPRRMVPAIQSR
jgi:AraC family transcriptional regulator of adaptative response / DNA-3-methyladenine glycosylase II